MGNLPQIQLPLSTKTEKDLPKGIILSLDLQKVKLVYIKFLKWLPAHSKYSALTIILFLTPAWRLFLSSKYKINMILANIARCTVW